MHAADKALDVYLNPAVESFSFDGTPPAAAGRRISF